MVAQFEDVKATLPPVCLVTVVLVYTPTRVTVGSSDALLLSGKLSMIRKPSTNDISLNWMGLHC